MLNKFWTGLIMIALLVACVRGKPELVTESALAAASTSVKYAFELIGLMSFWLGIMKVAEKAGLVDVLAKVIQPLTKRLFPSIPDNHPALGFIVLNISANVLGLGNAATPFGLKAMEQLQLLNKQSNIASDAMITFLVVNTSCIVIIPATIIGIRMAANSANATEIVGTTFLATCIGMGVALTVDGVWRKRNQYKR